MLKPTHDQRVFTTAHEVSLRATRKHTLLRSGKSSFRNHTQLRWDSAKSDVWHLPRAHRDSGHSGQCVGVLGCKNITCDTRRSVFPLLLTQNGVFARHSNYFRLLAVSRVISTRSSRADSQLSIHTVKPLETAGRNSENTQKVLSEFLP